MIPILTNNQAMPKGEMVFAMVLVQYELTGK